MTTIIQEAIAKRIAVNVIKQRYSQRWWKRKPKKNKHLKAKNG